VYSKLGAGDTGVDRVVERLKRQAVTARILPGESAAADIHPSCLLSR